MEQPNSINQVINRITETLKRDSKGSQMKKEQNSKQKACCSICDDVGFITHEDNGYTVYRPCKCRKMIKVQKIWEQSGIAVNDIDKNFVNFETWNVEVKTMKEMTLNYLMRFDGIKKERVNSIIFCGNPGCGKTHLSLALANKLMREKSIAVLYMPYRDIVTNLKQNVIDEDQYKRVLSKYQKAEVLLVDDMFKGNITKSDINIIFELINYRYLNRLPMIVSTECSIQEMLRIDESIGSRLYEMSKGYISEIKGSKNNYRLK